MDNLRLQQLVAETTLGIQLWERKITTKIIVDLEISFDIAKAIQFDSIEHTIDYDHLTQNLKNWFKQQHFHLLETLCHHTAQFVLENYSVESISVTIAKPGALEDVQSVSVTINRQRKEKS